MTLAAGARLGPYEIVARVGEGGMGVVYRARDERLGRDVAIKVISPGLAGNPERLQRFQLEARAAGRLNHPNIVTIHDLGSSDGSPYIVSEMVEGETVRARLASGAMPVTRAIRAAVQFANGLAAAHAAGIVHRDLKPENLILTPSGSLKILDFGIAKLFQGDGAQEDSTTGISPGMTRTGTVLGTASYMAPEQLRVQQVDNRTDLFAFGAILYEMLTGERAFPGDTVADRMSAILGSDPRPLPRAMEQEMPGIGRVVFRCLEKRPEDRFQDAGDLAFALELIEEREPPADAARAAASAPGASLPFPSFERLTYREGNIRVARFMPDGQSVVYGAALEGRPLELMWYLPGSPESRSLGQVGTDLFSVSSTGELAVSLRTLFLGGFITNGTLARMPMGGGAARELLESVREADWDPEGRQLAVVREVGGMVRIEYPIGRVLYETTGWASHLRFAPDGSHLAFLNHPLRGDDLGHVTIVDRTGETQTLTRDFSSTRGLAWKPDGSEIWFSGAEIGAGRIIFATTRSGSIRKVFSVPGASDLMDISRTGTVLIARGDERLHITLRDRSGTVSRDLSWLDWSLVRDITPDGTRILFDETGAGGGEEHGVYIRQTDGSPAVRLGDGTAIAFSPDGRYALSGVGSRNTIQLLPVGAGEVRTVPTEGLRVQWADWFPDGNSLCLTASEPGQGIRLYRLDLKSGRWTRVSDDEASGYQEARVSRDGRSAVTLGTEGEFILYSVEDGSKRSLPGIPAHARIVHFAQDDQSIFYFLRGQMPAPIYRLNLVTGERTHWVDLAPPSPAGVVTLTRIMMTPNAETFVYSYPRFLTDLYTVTGLQ
ncbi:MAG TPA: WD40 repeat domain-containing serine/threonine protein kinase [Candidatus Eisenbacteria bacterium]|nr:WD40 repeat domain-containing serine/threonine protein kinase [Candidatus Eisenbacteria bacterium]